jgi:AmmeMemoRadiSam system protein A
MIRKGRNIPPERVWLFAGGGVPCVSGVGELCVVIGDDTTLIISRWQEFVFLTLERVDTGKNGLYDGRYGEEGAKMMPEQRLSDAERKFLLALARQSLEAAVRKRTAPRIDPGELTSQLKEPGASFVTLTIRGMLRGCVGALEAYQNLAEDVSEHAMAAGLQDYRFPPVRPEELNQIEIEISRLTSPQPLHYTTPQSLVAKLRPGIDGVVLRDGVRRATFLPQVWEKLPDPAEFLEHLCAKMGADPQLWERKILEVLVYQVEEFHE